MYVFNPAPLLIFSATEAQAFNYCDMPDKI